MRLFQAISYVRQQGYHTGAFNGLGHFALILRAGASEAARKDFALLVDEFEQKDGVFVVDVLDTAFAEPAVLLALLYVFAKGVSLVGCGCAVAALVVARGARSCFCHGF